MQLFIDAAVCPVIICDRHPLAGLLCWCLSMQLLLVHLMMLLPYVWSLAHTRSATST